MHDCTHKCMCPHTHTHAHTRTHTHARMYAQGATAREQTSRPASNGPTCRQMLADADRQTDADRGRQRQTEAGRSRQRQTEADRGRQMQTEADRGREDEEKMKGR